MGTIVLGDGDAFLMATAHTQLSECLILTAGLMYQEMNLLTHHKTEIGIPKWDQAICSGLEIDGAK